MLYKSICILGFLFLGCSQKIPNTWQHRVVQAPLDEDIALHATIIGHGKPVVMLHGFGASSYTFSRLIPSLSQHFKIYAIDLKGFGASPKPSDDRYSVYDQAVLVQKFIQKHHLKNIILIGHSYGGGVALSLALMHPESIDKLVLIDSASYDQSLPKLIRWLQIPVIGKIGFYALSSRYEVVESYQYAFYDNRKIPEDIVAEYTKNLRSAGAKSVYYETSRQLIPEDIEAVSKQYKNIKIPTLIVWGENDIVIRKSKAYRLHRDISDSQLVIVPHCGHIPQEEKPEETLKVLEKFMLQ